MNTTLVIMAAWMGSRYGGLKQIDSFGPNGETILEYSIYDAIRAWFTDVVIIIRRSFEEQFKEVLGSRFDDKIRVQYAFQEINPVVEGFDSLPVREKPRGTGHAVLSAKDHIKGNFCVINADDYYGVDWYRQMHDWLLNKCKENTCSMVWYILENTLSENGTVNRGVCKVDSENNLTDIEERLKVWKISETMAAKPDGEETWLESIVSMNFWGFHATIFAVFEAEFHKFLSEQAHKEWSEFFITVPPNKFVHTPEKTCEVMVSKDKRYGVTYADDKITTQKAIKALVDDGVYPENLRE